jgi:hypothetical protein
MYGVFGFCDIRQFTDATECLQEEVMVFVNRIGNIVHTAAHRYAGAPNKNVGDAFLLVWRMTAEDRRAALETGVAASEAESESVLDSLLADNALFAFLRIMVDIEKSNKDGSLREYASNPKIMERFPGGFKVKMGFGLHYGWAIEGARVLARRVVVRSCGQPQTRVRHTRQGWPVSVGGVCAVRCRCDRVAVQDRRVVPVARREHGGTAGGCNKALPSAAAVVGRVSG